MAGALESRPCGIPAGQTGNKELSRNKAGKTIPEVADFIILP
jgi:hypothetical protein